MPRAAILRGVNARLAHGGAQRLDLGGKNIRRVVLHPAEPGIILGKFLGGGGHDAAFQRENNGPGAGGSLIQRGQIALVHHRVASSLRKKCQSRLLQHIVYHFFSHFSRWGKKPPDAAVYPPAFPLEALAIAGRILYNMRWCFRINRRAKGNRSYEIRRCGAAQRGQKHAV